VDLVMAVESDHFESIVGEWRVSGIEVVDTQRERDTDSVTVLLDGAPTETALADTLAAVTEESHVSISELSWTAADDASDRSCTRIRAVVDQSVDGDPLQEVRRLATERGCRLIE
jgi:ACT domain-containing protein